MMWVVDKPPTHHLYIIMTTPPKYPSTPHWPWSLSVHRDDSYHQDPEFFLGKQVVITEKLDGGNTCLWNGEVYARSVVSPSHDGWMAMVRKHHAWKTVADGESPRFLYGEDLYGIHSIEYEALKESETFRLFAVRQIFNNSPGPEIDLFHSWDIVEQEASFLGIKTVPVAMTGVWDTVEQITEFFNFYLGGGSALGGDCEGFVMRVADEFRAEDFALNVCKFVRPNHVQTDEHWRKNWKPCQLKVD